MKENKTKQTSKNTSRKSDIGLNKHPIYLTAIISFALVFVILVSLYIFMEGTHGVKTANGSQEVMSQKQNMITARNFLETYAPAAPLSNSIIFNNVTYDANGLCNSVGTIKWFTQPGINVNYTMVNFSKLNQSLPFAEYALVFAINQSNLGAYYSMVNKTGVCSPYMEPILKNSTFDYEGLHFGPTNIYMYTLSNFTETGFNLTNTKYIGNKPDLYWYFASTVYKGYDLQFGVWGFKDSKNDYYLLNQSKNFVNQFISYVPNK
jgi:hypothetical protein